MTELIWGDKKYVPPSLLPEFAGNNDFELNFAKFLDQSENVKAFSKLPEQLGFCIQFTDTLANIRNYYPDFIAVSENNTNWIIEIKGREDVEVALKDRALLNWCLTVKVLF